MDIAMDSVIFCGKKKIHAVMIIKISKDAWSINIQIYSTSSCEVTQPYLYFLLDILLNFCYCVNKL